MFPAFFDTNVLYGASLNDLILHLADRGLFRPLWSPDVLAELRRNLEANAANPARAVRRVDVMERHFRDALVTGYETLIPTMTNDEKDRHVLAAAVRGGAEVLVTFNLQDFPQESAAPFDIEVVHPESFLLDQLDLHRAATIQTVQRLIETYNSPTMTLDDYLLTLVRADVPEFADELRRQLY